MEPGDQSSIIANTDVEGSKEDVASYEVSSGVKARRRRSSQTASTVGECPSRTTAQSPPHRFDAAVGVVASFGSNIVVDYRSTPNGA
jgi:hypothetical protein